MKVGLYFGSFNPIHIGHLIIANHILNETDIQRVWFIVSPQNPFKQSATLLNEYDRLHLVQTAIEGNDRFRAMDIEFNLPRPSYTIQTLAYLSERYPAVTFYIIMGSDSYQNLDKWKNAAVIKRDYSIMVYERPGFPVDNLEGKAELLKAPLLQISATHIRELVQENKSIKYLVPSKVEHEILINRFFKKPQNK